MYRLSKKKVVLILFLSGMIFLILYLISFIPKGIDLVFDGIMYQRGPIRRRIMII